MASIREVAQAAQVSVGSVSRYLNGQQLKPQNMARIQAAIEALGYEQNIIAKGLKNNRSFAIGLLMNNMSSRLSMDIVASIQETIEDAGYGVLLSGFNDDKNRVASKLNYLRGHSVDGLLIFEADETWPGMAGLADSSIPVVSVNSPNHLPNVDSFLVNDRDSVAEVLGALVAQGHRHIGVIVAPQRDYTARERLAGVKKAQQLHPEAALTVYYGDYSRLSGYDGTKQLLAAGNDALFVCNFNMSLGSMEYLNQTGLRIDTDIAFAHFDYLDDSLRLTPKRLAIQQPATAIGRMAAERLLDRINGSQEHLGATYRFDNQISGLDRPMADAEVPTIID